MLEPVLNVLTEKKRCKGDLTKNFNNVKFYKIKSLVK